MDFRNNAINDSRGFLSNFPKGAVLDEVQRVPELSEEGIVFGNYEDAIFKGLYPRLYDKNIEPVYLYPSYISTYIEKDVRQIKNIENLIINEFIKNKLHNGHVLRFFFWQNKTKQEIDLIVESANTLTPFEIKSGMTMQESYFSNLKYWQKLTNEESKNLNVIYGGDDDFKTSAGNFISWKSLASVF